MKIKLPDFVLADLYRNSLVITDEVVRPHSAGDEPKAEPAWFLGNNKKKITVLVNDASHRFTDQESLQLLTNMLSALEMTLDDIVLININTTAINYKDMITQFQTRVCLLFDVPTQAIGLPFQMPDYKVQLFDNCKFLYSASLQKMKTNSKEAKLEKTKLWMCLKSIFE